MPVSTGSKGRPRSRRKHHKVATGCANCKQRRVKCDETEGGCERCQRANLFCPGYNPPRARIFESSRSSEASASETDLLTRTHGRYTTSPSPAFVDLRLVWQAALLDSFLTTWLPHSLVRKYTSGEGSGHLVPMSAWPLTAWKLAKTKQGGLVAHALLCLTLCVLGSHTSDHRLLAEAARHYAQVLHQFQAKVHLLARTGYSAKQDEHVASLAAAGLCCSQVEYILQSWANGDKHLQGMEALLDACGPACLRYDDTRTIFYDHCLLWSSCAVTHHQPAIYSQPPWDSFDWMDWPYPFKTLLNLARRIPILLREYDTSQQEEDAVDMDDLLQRLVDVVVDIETLHQPDSFISQAHSQDKHDNSTSPPPAFHIDPFCVAVMAGYSSAFVHHAGIAAWEIIRSREAYHEPRISGIDLTHDRLRKGCERHQVRICQSIEELADARYGMITASPLLFLLDSAWMGYTTLAEFCGHDLDEVRPWFIKVSQYVTGTGYRPLREPWLMTEPMPSAGAFEEHDVRMG